MFEECISLNIIITNSVTKIESRAFWNCTSLQTITIDKDNMVLMVQMHLREVV